MFHSVHRRRTNTLLRPLCNFTLQLLSPSWFTSLANALLLPPTLIILVGFPDDVPLRFLPARGWLINRSKPATFTVCGRRRRCPRRDVCWRLENAT